MYEVQKHFESEDDLRHFLNTTKKFSKRFYNVTGETVGTIQHILHIVAVAISRDLTYVLRMNIQCKEYPKTPADDDKDPDKRYPEFGWIPTNKEVKNLYYPFADNYQDIFDYNGFHKVGSIYNDGIDMTG